MTDIQVFIQGLVLLVSSGVYKHGLTGTGAAVALHAEGRPGKYGVDLPRHDAVLLIDKDPVLTSDPPLTEVDGANHYVVHLTGQRIQVGRFDGQCHTDDPRGKPGAGGSLESAPSLGSASLPLPSTRITDDSRPSSLGVYSGVVKPSRVDGWLELLGGTIADDTPTEVMAEIRPPATTEYKVAKGSMWTLRGVNAPCLVITPFESGTTRTVVFDPGATTVTMTFKNSPVPSQNGHKHGRPGASYDFELLYDLFEQQPAIPPVPHLRLPEKTVAGGEAGYLRDCVTFCLNTSKPTTDPVSGSNCIDGFVGDPGDPHP